MNNLLSLIKVQFIELFSSVDSSKKKKRENTTFVASLLGVGILLVTLSVLYNYMIFQSFKLFGNTENYLPLVFIISQLLTFFLGIVKIKSTLFGNKDYNLLESMPIRHRTIISSKIIVTFLYELIFSVGVILPALVISSIDSFNFQVLLYGIIAMLFEPIFPLLLAGILSIPITLLFDRFKYGKIIQFFLYIVFIASIFFISYGSNNALAQGQAFDSLVVLFDKFYLPSILFKKAMAPSGLYILLFVLANLGLIILFIGFTSLLYKKVNEIMLSSRSNVEYKSRKLLSSSQLKSLVRVEIKRIFSSTQVMVNSLLGGIMTIIMVVIMYISLKNPLGESWKELAPIIAPYMVFCILFGLGISPISASSISLEGEAFWIIKSSPIEAKTYLKSKLIPSILLPVPTALIASIIIIVLFKLSVVASIFIILIPQVYNVLMSLIGMTLQLKYPHMHFISEIDVIKKSKSVVYVMLVGFLIESIAAGIIVVFSTILKLDYAAYSILLGVFIILTILFYIYIKKKGEVLFNKIS